MNFLKRLSISAKRGEETFYMCSRLDCDFETTSATKMAEHIWSHRDV
jgi:hypothetical protein